MVNKSFIDALVDTTNKAINATNANTSVTTNVLPSMPSADGNGLPFTKVLNNRKAVGFKANLITWYVPEFGAIKMWINPSNLTIRNKKDIYSTRTKGGFTLQYFGESLTELSIGGTTGSSRNRRYKYAL